VDLTGGVHEEDRHARHVRPARPARIPAMNLGFLRAADGAAIFVSDLNPT